jgi:hypothetical protein
MQLQTAQNEVHNHNINNTKRATITLNDVAYEVLSTNIYTNCPEAIVRELCCNALDSHTAAGQTKPFSITVPTYLDQRLIIQDFGLGLSDEEVYTLFTSYFGSNKRNTNSQIGGFGLGSKTPLSYTSAFSFTSVYHGTKRCYTVFKDEDNIPAVSCLHAEPTDESNGVCIEIAVQTEDISAFCTAARRILSYFPAGSFTLTGTEVEPVSYYYRDEVMGLRKPHNSHPDKIKAIVGPVAYELDEDRIYAHMNSDNTDGKDWNYYYGLLHSISLDLFFDIGELSLQVSRERLNYTKKTLDLLVKRLVSLDFEPVVQEVVESKKLYVERAQLAEKFSAIYKERTWRDPFPMQNDPYNINIFEITAGRTPTKFNVEQVYSIGKEAEYYHFIQIPPKKRISMIRFAKDVLEDISKHLGKYYCKHRLYFVRMEKKHIPEFKRQISTNIVAYDDLPPLPPLRINGERTKKEPTIWYLPRSLDFNPLKELPESGFTHVYYFLMEKRKCINRTEEETVKSQTFFSTILPEDAIVVGLSMSALPYWQAKLEEEEGCHFIRLHEFIDDIRASMYQNQRYRRCFHGAREIYLYDLPAPLDKIMKSTRSMMLMKYQAFDNSPFFRSAKRIKNIHEKLLNVTNSNSETKLPIPGHNHEAPYHSLHKFLTNLFPSFPATLGSSRTREFKHIQRFYDALSKRYPLIFKHFVERSLPVPLDKPEFLEYINLIDQQYGD